MATMSSHSLHASRPSTFQAPDGERLRRFCCGRSTTLWRLVPFSHRSASRIFVKQPDRLPPPMGNLVERSEPGCGLRLTLIFKGLRHPCWGRGQAEPELYLPHGFVGHLLPQHSGERELTVLAEGADFDNAGSSGRKRRLLPRARFAGSAGSGAASGATFRRWAECGYLPVVWAAVAPHAPGDRPRRRALLGRRSCSWAVLPLLRYNIPARRSVFARPGGPEWGSAGGQMAVAVSAEVVAAGEVLVADEIAATIRAPGLRLFGFDSLSSPLEWRRGRGPCRSSVCPEVIAAAVWPPGAEVVVAGTEPESRL
jgi:hypothetical protein